MSQEKPYEEMLKNIKFRTEGKGVKTIKDEILIKRIAELASNKRLTGHGFRRAVIRELREAGYELQ